MITLLHEDIDVFIDPVEIVSATESGSNYSVTNDSTKSVGDLGKMTITIDSGDFTSLVIDMGYDSTTINTPMPAGTVIVLDFTNKQFTKDGQPIFLSNLPVIQNDTITTISFSFTGTGASTLNYEYLKPTMSNDSVMFCTSIDANENNEILSKVDINGKLSYTQTAKKEYQWSINGTWNATEISKFNDGLFRMRLVDIDGMELETLANCMVVSTQRGSGEGTDYTYTINGLCEEIFN